jgi:hypothetical protein
MGVLAGLFLIAASVLAQDAIEVEVKVAPLGIPCEPGGPGPLPPGIPFVCPPVEEQGVMVFLRTDAQQVRAYRTRVKYTATDGSEKEAMQVVRRTEESAWTVDVFRIGRIQTERLPGVKVQSVEVEALESLEEVERAASGERKC